MIEEPSSHDTGFMREALKEAALATALGEVPIAAVIIREGTVVARSHNFRETRQDPTAHAEVIAIRTAARELNTWRLTGTTMYVTVEPCPMCLGAVILARIPRLVFGAPDPKAGACGSVLNFANDLRLNHRVRVVGGVLEGECQSLLQQFFQELRSRER
ncbi:tRNA-specific adenosine deaminase [Nitrospira sp. KM1]|uniref:tRNA adenosine(34) deaminase TadA n=1 Tax=Nitrospira sp. KM1 TaxID=1936990 RepID=UPI0013A7563E|nr:tRNA adenosine(34) deaminase TadA [Nitrospira sp. KM1]BCA53186.1 tRNA-specific adenosine deaminase [Nitrospira sp. KM1]